MTRSCRSSILLVCLLTGVGVGGRCFSTWSCEEFPGIHNSSLMQMEQCCSSMWGLSWRNESDQTCLSCTYTLFPGGAHTQTHTHRQSHTLSQTHTYSHSHTLSQTYTHTHFDNHTHFHIHTHTHTHSICIHMYIENHTYIHTCIQKACLLVFNLLLHSRLPVFPVGAWWPSGKCQNTPELCYLSVLGRKPLPLF